MDQNRHRGSRRGIEIPQGNGGVEADDFHIILERIDEPGDLRGGLRAGLQERMHGIAADGFIRIIEGGLLQCGTEHR